VLPPFTITCSCYPPPPPIHSHQSDQYWKYSSHNLPPSPPSGPIFEPAGRKVRVSEIPCPLVKIFIVPFRESLCFRCCQDFTYFGPERPQRMGWGGL